MSKLITEKSLAAGTAAATIEFPCAYPIKVLGSATLDFEVLVIEVIELHVENFDPATLSSRDSNKGTYRSITLTINATGAQQLEQLHRALMALDPVKMVL